MPDAVMLSLALAACVLGMGWLALSLDAHWEQVRAGVPRSVALVGALRGLGAGALIVALVLCLLVDSASIAVLVWLMALAAAALTIAFTLTWRARVLEVLVFWAPR